MAATSRYDVRALTLALQAISDKLDVPEAKNLQHLLGLKRELTKTLNFLQTAADEARSSLESPPPILEGFKAWTESLPDTLDPAAPPDPGISSTAVWYQRTLQNRSRWTKSPSGILLYLSLLPEKQSKAFEWDPGHAPIDRWRAHVVGLVSETMADDMSYYLDVLNAELNNREPDEFHKEALWAEMRDAMVPDYQTAATIWPRHANQHWAALRPKVFTLFNSSNTYNFVQWALEWIQITGLESLGVDRKKPDAKGAQAIIDLTKDLCSGSLSPLHMAALLGLPNLCDDLVSAGMDPNRSWKGRTPLHCALEGNTACFGVYVFGASVHSLSDPYICYQNRRLDFFNREERTETIRCLLGYTNTICEEVSRGTMAIAPLALLTAQNLNKPEILEWVIDRGATLDERIYGLLTDDALSPKTEREAEGLSMMLTYLHGKCILDRGGCKMFRELIEEGMVYHEIDFHLVDGSCPLLEATPERLLELAEASIISGSSFDLRRICLERRFKPNPVLGEIMYGKEGLLHLAVENGSLEMIDLLMKTGADLEALDEDGRTPLMNAETPGMIEKLVLQYGASTECQDGDGRTIWHSAAYNDDVPVLTWLTQSDPWKENNLTMQSNEGCTPLAEAMMTITRAEKQGLGQYRAQEPLAARYLVSKAIDHGDQCLASPIPLTHLVVAWGETQMLEDLMACGADWHQLDADGLSALHYLNLSATPFFVQWIKSLVTPAVYSKARVHVAEAFFSNIANMPFYPHRPYVASLPDVMDNLQVSSLVRSTDDRGRYWWHSFCSSLLPKALKIAKPNEKFLYPLLGAALNCFLGVGALKVFEEAHGKSGVLCMFDKESKASWDQSTVEGGWFQTETALVMVPVLRDSDPVLLEEFFKSPEAILLMLHALQLDHDKSDSRLVKMLCQSGLPVFSSRFDHLNLTTPLEMVLKLQFPFRGIMSEFLMKERVTADELTQGLPRIMRALVDSMKSNKRTVIEATKLKMLLDKGMNPRGFRTDAGLPNVLHEAIAYGRLDFIKLLIDHGVDPDQPCNVCGFPSSVYCAVQFSSLPMLEYLINKLPTGFPCGDDTEGTEGRRFSQSAALLCVSRGFSKGFALIMDRTSAGEFRKDAEFLKACLGRLNYGHPCQLVSILKSLRKHDPEAFKQALLDNVETGLSIMVSFISCRESDIAQDERYDRKLRRPLISFMGEYLDVFQGIIDHTPKDILGKYVTEDKDVVGELEKAGFRLHGSFQ